VTGQTNTLYSAMMGKSVGVPARSDGTNGINWVAANDPRVKPAALGKGTDGATDVYQFVGYNSLGAPIAIANGIEARLIEAEPALQANKNDASTTGSGWLGILNSLRATSISPAMSPLADPGNFDARVNLLFRERAFWLCLTAHRMGDLRRLIRQYNRPPESVFPTGMYHDGVPYGAELNLIPPNTEAPNSNYQGCIDRNA
jgi:starch-binding outer membrane protein, SusD/RagB family